MAAGGHSDAMNVRFREIVPVASAVVVAAYGAHLILIGQLLTMVSPDGQPALSVQAPNMAGLIPLAAGLLVVVGIARRRQRLAWIGALAALAFSILFLFGVGGILIPIAGLLVLSLALIRRSAVGRPADR